MLEVSALVALSLLVGRKTMVVAELVGDVTLLPSQRAMQSSVKLRHMLSALRRICRSGAEGPLTTEAAE